MPTPSPLRILQTRYRAVAIGTWLLLSTLAVSGCSSAGLAPVDLEPAAADALEDAAMNPPDSASETTPDPDAKPETRGDAGDRSNPGVVLVGGRDWKTGERLDLRFEGATIVAVGVLAPGPDDTVVDVADRWLVPAFIDSHVHLSYRPGPALMADGGVAAAVDHAAPIESLAEDPSPLRLLGAGPMITAPAGYPTQSWGSNGYGLECDSPACATAAVQSLFAAGAGLIKVPFDGGPALSNETVDAIVAAAHERGLRVSAHALDTGDVERATEAGVDVLAHTPVGTISDELATRFTAGDEPRAVISTLRAFGGSASARANLATLRSAGGVVLYGTDYGNTSTPGIDPKEIALLEQAGMDGEAIIVSGTSAPAAFWGFETMGALKVGADASVLVLCQDPRAAPIELTRPSEVWVAGLRRVGAGAALDCD